MAEILGVVASGISIAQLAGQVTQNIIKLKDYWDQVKNAPVEIDYILRKADVLNLILLKIQKQQAQYTSGNTTIDNSSLTQCLKLCKDGSDELNNLASELAEKINGGTGWRRKVGSAKVVLKKEEIKRLEKRLESAVNLLSLSFEYRSSIIMQIQSQIMIASITSNVTNHITNQITSLSSKHTDTDDTTNEQQALDKPQPTEPNKVIIQRYTYWKSYSSLLHCTLGKFKYNRQVRMHKGNERTEFHAQYMFPDWLPSKVWEYSGFSSLSMSRLNFRSYRLLPKESKYFSAVMKRDVNAVREMLRNREACVNDWAQEYFGRGIYEEDTALHVAVKHGDFEMCRMLLFQGADACALNRYKHTPLHACAELGSLDVCRLLISSGANELLIDAEDSIGSILSSVFGQFEFFQYLQNEIYPPFHQLSSDTRLWIAAEQSWQCSVLPSEPFLPRLCLQIDGIIDHSILNWQNRSGRSFLHFLSVGIIFQLSVYTEKDLNAALLDDSTSLENIRELSTERNTVFQLRGLARDIIAMGIPLHSVNTSGQTPLLNSIGVWSWALDLTGSFSRLCVLKHGMSCWLTDLAACNIDLEEYGREEHEIFIKSTKDIRQLCYYFDYRLINFSFGPKPEDWNFYILEPTDYLAGDFWEMIEKEDELSKLNLAIPGAWNEEAE